MPTLSPTDKANVKRIFDSLNVPIPLEFMTNLFDFEGLSFFSNSFSSFIGYLITLSFLCNLLLGEPLWAFCQSYLPPFMWVCVQTFGPPLPSTKRAQCLPQKSWKDKHKQLPTMSSLPFLGLSLSPPLAWNDRGRGSAKCSRPSISCDDRLRHWSTSRKTIDPPRDEGPSFHMEDQDPLEYVPTRYPW